MNKEKRKKIKELNLQIKLMQQDNQKTFQEFSPDNKNKLFNKQKILLLLLGCGSAFVAAFCILVFIL